MFKKIILHEGITIQPRSKKISISESKIQGNDWIAEHVGDKFLFEFQSSRQGGGDNKERLQGQVYPLS